jgi:hypothetical protein
MNLLTIKWGFFVYFYILFILKFLKMHFYKCNKRLEGFFFMSTHFDATLLFLYA